MMPEKNNSKNKKTVLFDSHISLNAKMVSYAGYEMPISYPKGIQSEYFSIRNDIGMFDVSHMGELKVTGKNALTFLQKVTINDVKALEVGQAQYSAMCNDDGGIIDDLILYRMKDGYLMVINAANINKDFDWLKQHVCDGMELENISEDISLIAIQGPNTREFLKKYTDVDLTMPFYTFREGHVCESSVMVSRTGYTGELGFEIYGNSKAIKLIWNTFIDLGIYPAGLAARDILRMEMKYCLYGNDINEKSNPLEAGLGWITALGKKSFIGSEKLGFHKMNGLKKKLIAFKMNERGIPRPGYEIYINNDKIGNVTSGNHSPLLKIGIGLAYVDIPYDKSGQEISIKVRNKLLNAIVIQSPFLSKTSLYE